MRKFTIITIVAILALTGIANAQTVDKISVSIAGDGTAAFNGDGTAGYMTEIYSPHDVCMDAAQNIYFTDLGNGRIRKISAKNGVVTTIAGGGTSTADGIPATSASIKPYFMCIDGMGNLYFSDNGSNKVRTINATTGIITTVAGTGATGYTGDGSAATAATLNNPLGICIDAANNIYIVDSGNNAIRKVAATTGIITTFAGTGAPGYTGDAGPATSATLDAPSVICADAAGDIFVADQSSGWFSAGSSMVVREISAGTGIINTIAGEGTSSAILFNCTALSSFLGYVTGMCCDGSGNIYCNEISCSCRKIDMTRDSVYAVAGNFSVEGYADDINSLLAYMNYCFGLCVDPSGNVIIADSWNNRIRKVIPLTSTPTFAHGAGQTIYPCSGTSLDIDKMMAMTVLDSAQTETWTVVSAPVNGTLSGFPYTGLSLGTYSVATTLGLAYTSTPGYGGMDSFQVMVSNGTSSNIITVYANVFNALTSAGTITGPSSICESTSVLFTTSGTPGGVWSTLGISASSTGSGMIAGVSPGLDSVIYTITNSCGTSATSLLIQVIDSFPNPGSIAGIDIIEAGNSTNLTDTISGGTWSTSNSAISTVTGAGAVYGVNAGVDSVIYTVTNACGTRNTYFPFTVVADTTTGVNNVASVTTDKMMVSPNPATEQININVVSPFDEQVTITITNVAGEKVKEFTGTTNKQMTEQMDVPAGVYYLNATSAHVNQGSKIVKE